MIIAHHLNKKFNQRHALQDVSFSIDQGEWVSILGSNGAGKTTLNRILSLLTRPTSGRAQVADLWLDKDPDQVRRRIGVVSHHPLLYTDLSVWENLHFYATMYAIDRPQERIAALLQQSGLYERRTDLVRSLSRGMQQRLALARALLHQPTVLLLDEPFTGLDVQACQFLTGIMQQAAQERITVLMTTHDVEYALANSQRLLVLVKGRLLLDKKSGLLGKTEIIQLMNEE